MHPPRREPVGRVVVPRELLAHLVHPAVDDEGVLRRAGAVGPPAADLHPDDVTVDHARPRAPVPVHRVGPPARGRGRAPPTTRRPAPACSAPSTHSRPTAGRATSLTVYWNSRGDQGTTTPIASCPGGRSASTSRRSRGAVTSSRVPSGTGSTSIERSSVRARAGSSPSRPGSVAPRASGSIASWLTVSPVAPVVHPHRVHAGVVERRHGHTDQVGRRGDGPVLPALVAAPAVAAGADPAGVVQRMPGPPHRGRVQPAVRSAEVDLGRDLALGDAPSSVEEVRDVVVGEQVPGSSRSRTARKSSKRG